MVASCIRIHFQASGPVGIGRKNGYEVFSNRYAQLLIEIGYIQCVCLPIRWGARWWDECPYPSRGIPGFVFLQYPAQYLIQKNGNFLLRNHRMKILTPSLPGTYARSCRRLRG